MNENTKKFMMVMTSYKHYNLFWSSKEIELKRYVNDILFYFHEPYPNQLQLVFRCPESYILLVIDWDGLQEHCQPGISAERHIMNIINSFQNEAPSIAIWAVS